MTTGAWGESGITLQFIRLVLGWGPIVVIAILTLKRKRKENGKG